MMVAAGAAANEAASKLTNTKAGKSTAFTEDDDMKAADITPMPHPKHVIKDTTFFYFSQTGEGSEFQKRRLVLTQDKLCIALEDSEREIDMIPLHEVMGFRV